MATMKKATIDSTKSIIENYNAVFERISRAKSIEDVRGMVDMAKQFISLYKKADKEMVNTIYEKLRDKLGDLIEENDFMFNRINARVEEISNRGYDFANEKDDSQAVQSKVLQLISQMPKVMNNTNANRITKILNESIRSGVVGSKAVMELLKYPAYADMVSASIRERAFNGSQSLEQKAFETNKAAELKKAQESLSTVYLEGFHLRNITKRVDAFRKPSTWNPEEETA